MIYEQPFPSLWPTFWRLSLLSVAGGGDRRYANKIKSDSLTYKYVWLSWSLKQKYFFHVKVKL